MSDDKRCFTCKHEKLKDDADPCCHCFDRSRWEPKPSLDADDIIRTIESDLATLRARVEELEQEKLEVARGRLNAAHDFNRRILALESRLAMVTECNESMREPMRLLREAASMPAEGEGTVVRAVLARLARAERIEQVMPLCVQMLHECIAYIEDECPTGAQQCERIDGVIARADAALKEQKP